VLESLANLTNLLLEIMYDDGFKLWINDSNALNVGMPAGEVAYNVLASGPTRESANYDLYILNNARNYLRVGTNVIAMQVHNIQLANEDCYVDLRLRAQIGPSSFGRPPVGAMRYMPPIPRPRFGRWSIIRSNPGLATL